MTTMDRLSRRGKLTIEVEDGRYDVRLVTPGPYSGGRCTIDKADLFEHCRLGAKNWQGEGDDLDALLLLCEMESRPDNHGINDLVWIIGRRRESRTHGPPLPSYRRWHGGSPGQERWLRTSSHKYEYLDGYLHYGIAEEQKFETERAASEARRALPQVPARIVLGSTR